MSRKVVLQTKNLTTCFKTRNGVLRTVDDVSFEVYESETLGIVGESGCGKSVTSLSIMGLLPKRIAFIEKGEILFDGNDLTKFSDKEMRKIRGNDISMIFQEPMTSLNPVFTIGEQLSEPLKQHTNLSKEEIKEKIIEMCNLIGIPHSEEIIHEYPHQLSGGMRQRVMIALAMLCEPKLLIADEPTTALDVTIQAQILELMKDIKKKSNMALMLITHDLGVVAEMCDRVIVMYAGQIVEQAEVRKLFYEPKHPYTKGLLTSLPKSNEPKSELNTIPGAVPRPDEYPKGCRFAPRCKFATEKCWEQPPPVVKSDNQTVRCWLYENEKEGEQESEQNVVGSTKS